MTEPRHGQPFQGPPFRMSLAIYGTVAVVWGLLLARNVAQHLRFEDAMIVLRYARNLIGGEGFVFNPGERVLGVTTPLHTLISTIYVAVGGETAPFFQNVAGLLALAAQGALLLVLLVRLGRPWAALPAALCVLGSYNLSWVYMGMETHLFVALTLGVLCLSVDDRGFGSARREVLLGVVLGAAFLLRYDAALLAGLVGLERWHRTKKLPWIMTLAFFACVTPWLLFAQIYFGSILPEPLRAKQGFGSTSTYLEQVYGYYRHTFERLLLAFSPSTRAAVWASWTLPVVVVWGAATVVRSRVGLLFVFYPLLHLAVYAGLASDPNFTWHHYLLNPYGFAWVALAADDLVRRLGRLGTIRSRVDGRRWPAYLLLAAACLPVLLHLGRHVTGRYQPDQLTSQLHAMADWMKDRYPQETSLLQPAIGILGWRTGFRMVDHAGLVTPGLYFYNDQDCTPLEEVVRLHRPDLILHSPWAQGDPAALGYEEVHNFEKPFAYRLFEYRSRD